MRQVAIAGIVGAALVTGIGIAAALGSRREDARTAPLPRTDASERELGVGQLMATATWNSHYATSHRTEVHGVQLIGSDDGYASVRDAADAAQHVVEARLEDRAVGPAVMIVEHPDTGRLCNVEVDATMLVET